MKRLLPILAIAALAAAASCGSGSSIMDSVRTSLEDFAAPDPTPLDDEPVTGTMTENVLPDTMRAVMPPFPYTSLRDAPYREVFNDSNRYQLAFAMKYGIQPIEDIGMSYFTSAPIVKITDTQLYRVDTLTHSVPFLVPRAADLLNEIGKRFADRMKAQGIHGYRLRITSLLRTPDAVKKLRRVNRNATAQSAHQFATTFDIAYNKFFDDPGATPVDQARLKVILAEVLFELRREERCMVKYEIKTPCFHITVTK